MIGLATGGLVAAVWQGILLAAVVGLGLRLLPKTPAAVRFAIWFAVFVMVAALPAVSLWPHAIGAARMAGRGAWLTLDARWSLAIAAVWAVASLVRAVTLVVAAFQVRALWKRAKPVELGGLANPTHRDSAAMNGAPGILPGTRRVRICTSDEVDRPAVIGFFAPKILIPGWLLEKLTAAELEQIVLHEAGHLGRADDWMNLLQKVALVAFPLNPALAWVERRLCFERELAVDERVLQAFAGKAGAAKAYAACLATLAEHRLGRRGFALALGALGRESELGRRVGRILRREEGMKPLHARLVLGGAMLGLVAGAVGLERCPQVVGFAPESASVMAADDGSGYRAVASYNSNQSNGLQKKQDDAHEVLLGSAVGMARVGIVRSEEVSRGLKPQVGAVLVSGLKSGPISEARTTAEAGTTRVSETRMSDVDSVASERQPTLRDGVANDGAPRFVASQGVRTVQWVVVRTWQSEDGSSRVVLTTARTVSAAGAVPDAPPEMGDSRELRQQQPQLIYPYAAVPVRGGWLVFQL